MTVLIRPDADDRRLVGAYLGMVLVGVGWLHLPGIVVAAALGEVDDAIAMLVGGLLAWVSGRLATRRWSTDRRLDWAHGLVTVALAWLVAPLPISVSFHLTGHFRTWLDAWFEAMSGLTTSGMTMLMDLDHLGTGVQLLRHLTHFAGGQGIILVVITVLSAGGQIGTLFVGEGREERIVPSIVRTARLIYLIFFAWAVVGVGVLWTLLAFAGLGPGAALMHATSLFLAAFDTGGFSVQSPSVAYYHSAAVELALLPIMLGGAVSFPLHWRLWQGDLRAATRHLDLRALATTTTVLTFLVVLGLGANAVFPDAVATTRRGVFTALSAATNTGFSVVPGSAYATWGQLAPGALVAIMLVGSMAGSTAGGIKTIRVAIVAKSVLRDIRKALSPPAAVILASYRTGTRSIITDKVVSGAVTITVLYLLTAIAGALLHVAYGASIEVGLFESTSATANVGLSTGGVNPDNPAPLKVVTALQMWAGRLEFLAVIALVGYGAALVRGRR